MGDKHRKEVQAGGRAENAADENEHQHQGDPGDDIGIGHRQVGNGIHHTAIPTGAQFVDAHRGGGADHRGNGHSGKCQYHRVFQCLQSHTVVDQLRVPTKRESREYRETLGIIERKHQQNGDRREQKEKYQGSIDLRSDFHLTYLRTSAVW